MCNGKLIRVDRNGTQYYESHVCQRCGGTGYIPGMEHVDGGICFLCGGTGRHTTTWKVYTPEYEEKLAERRRKRNERKNPEYFHKHGLANDGSAFVVIGKTYEMRHELKAAGAHYVPCIGWYFAHSVENYETLQVTIDKFATNFEGAWKIDDLRCLLPCVKEAQEAKKTASYIAENSSSDFVGKIGDKVTVNVTLDRVSWYETQYGTMNVYTFVDDSGNMYVWKTSTDMGRFVGDFWQEYKKGERLTLTGKIKDHNEYKGVKQTVLTRCKYQQVENL